MTIRNATLEDLEQIWTLFKMVIDQNAYYAYDHATTKEHIEATWIHLDNIIIVAEVNNSIGGACIIKPNQPGHGAHIANAAYMVDTELRNKGIGRALAKHSLEQARQAGYLGMQYNMVLKTNANAVHLYQDLGFEIIGTVPEAFLHYEKGYVDAHIMFKKL